MLARGRPLRSLAVELISHEDKVPRTIPSSHGRYQEGFRLVVQCLSVPIFDTTHAHAITLELLFELADAL